MAGIIKDGEAPKVLWPAVKLWYEAAQDAEKQMELESILKSSRTPLTRWQKFKAPFQEIWYRVKIAFDILRKGDESRHLDIDW